MGDLQILRPNARVNPTEHRTPEGEPCRHGQGSPGSVHLQPQSPLSSQLSCPSLLPGINHLGKEVTFSGFPFAGMTMWWE